MIDIKFGITWLFDKLGYMPKIDMEVGKVNLDLEGTWPFPVPKEELKKKPVRKSRPLPSRATVAKKAAAATRKKAK